MTRTIVGTRRGFLGAIAATGLLAAGAGAATTALFVDSETETGNVLSAGTLDLTVDGVDASVALLSEVDVAPGDSGQATVTVANAGSLPGYVDVRVASLTNYENGLVGNEDSSDTSGGDPGEGNGELQEYLEVQAAFRDGPDLWSSWETAVDRLASGTVYDLDYRLPSGGTDEFVLDWRLPTDAGEDAQSDSIEFSITFSLDQQSDTGA